MKKTAALFLVLVICFSVITPAASAAARDLVLEQELASDLKSLSLFKGVSDTDFDLGRAPTRTEAVVMLIRVLGKESAALGADWSHPFTDVAPWASKYIGYAYQNGLTKGMSDTQFGTGNASAAMYLTFVLRALGYSDTDGKDFTWDNPFSLASGLSILPDKVSIVDFWRADVVLVSYSALPVKMKGSTQTLAEKLMADKVFSKAQYNTYYDANAISAHVNKTPLNAEEIYEKCAPAVFYIEVCNSKGIATASGSGFFLDSQGTAVTNYHVIDGAYSAKVTVSGTQKVYNVSGVYDYSKEQDWAILKIDGTGFSYLQIGDASTVVGGATVYAIGSPLGLQSTITQGLISNTNRVEDGVSYIQTSAAISSGSSGGALINKYGQAVGITSASYVDGQNLNLALPMRYIKGYSTSSVKTLLSLVVNPSAQIKPYADYQDIPDCGAYFGVKALSTQNTSRGRDYYYSLASLNEVGIEGSDLQKYQEVLLDWGFDYVDEYTVGADYYFEYELNTAQKSYVLCIIYKQLNGTKCMVVSISSNDMPPAKGYAKCSAVPDFGAFVGVREISGTDVMIGTTKFCTNYQYSASSLFAAGFNKSLLNAYGQLLETWGFNYIGTTDDNIAIFQNRNLDYEVTLSANDTVFFVNIFYSCADYS